MRKLLTILYVVIAIEVFIITSSAVIGQFQQKPMLGVQIDGAYLQSDFVAAWFFLEGSGDKVSDLSGNGNAGVITGATWIAGKFGSALDFDGVGDYVSVPNLDFGSKLAISVWLYSKDATPYRQGVVAQATDDNNAVYFGTGSGNTVVMVVKNAGVQNAAAESSALEQNKWIHYVGVFNGSNVILYKNGVEIARVSQTVNPPTMTGDVRIAHDDGWWAAEGDDFFNGLIGHVIIWNRALTAREIAELYRDPFGMFVKDDIAMLEAGITAPPAPGGQVIMIQMGVFGIALCSLLWLNKRAA